jgi:hypothetical protein
MNVIDFEIHGVATFGTHYVVFTSSFGPFSGHDLPIAGVSEQTCFQKVRM